MKKIVALFLSTFLIWWGWDVLACRLNIVTFEYWEIFAIRAAFANIFKIIGNSFKNK